MVQKQNDLVIYHVISIESQIDEQKREKDVHFPAQAIRDACFDFHMTGARCISQQKWFVFQRLKATTFSELSLCPTFRRQFSQAIMFAIQLQWSPSPMDTLYSGHLTPTDTFAWLERFAMLNYPSTADTSLQRTVDTFFWQ